MNLRNRTIKLVRTSPLIIHPMPSTSYCIGHNTNQAMTGMLAGRRMMSVALPSKRGFEAIAKDEEKVGDAPLHRATNTLMDINVTVKKGMYINGYSLKGVFNPLFVLIGQLVAVVGPVGSGKSSFLNALLGELHLKSGSVRVAGSVSYCDQKPWILNATGNLIHL